MGELESYGFLDNAYVCICRPRPRPFSSRKKRGLCAARHLLTSTCAFLEHSAAAYTCAFLQIQKHRDIHLKKKDWRQWRKRAGERIRSLALRVLRFAVGEPQAPSTPAPPDTATRTPRASASNEVLNGAAPRERASQETAAPLAPGAPDEAPLSLPRGGKWLDQSISIPSGRVDLAPWVLPARSYKVYEPAELGEPPGILLVLHGCRQSAEDIAVGTRLNEHADERGWLVLYPQQAKLANKNNCWNWFDPANNRGDGECALVVAMHDAVRERFGLAGAPTFLAGMSAGGALASQLALLFPERWAGVAIHSGLPYGAATDPWAALRVMREGATSLAAARALRRAAPDAPAIPAIVLHGNKDAVVNRRNADLLVRQFLGWDGYFGDSDDWENAPIHPVDDSHVKTRYGHPYILRDYCLPSRAQVRECEVIGMGHAWSGGDSTLPYHDELGPDASALMVEFFAGIVTDGSSSEAAEVVH